MRCFVTTFVGFLTGAHLRLYFGGGGSPAPRPAPPQAAPPAPAPLTPPSQTEMDAKVVNPEARRRGVVAGRANRIFGSRATPQQMLESGGMMGYGSTTLGSGR